MTNHYTTLGVDKNATAEEIKKTYRRLAQQHHPDKGGDAAKFRAVTEAYEVLSDTHKRGMYDRLGTGFDSGNNSNHFGGSAAEKIIRAMHEHARRNAVHHITLQVKIENAFAGAKIPLSMFGHSIGYQLKAGLPHGVQYMDEVVIGDEKRRLVVELLIDAGEFRFRRAGSDDGNFFSGDLERDIEVDVLDLLLGGWTVVSDFLNKQLQVRIPSGFDTAHRLKVSGHGYSNWTGNAASNRGDLYLRVIPKIKPIDQLDHAKIKELYDLTRPPKPPPMPDKAN